MEYFWNILQIFSQNIFLRKKFITYYPHRNDTMVEQLNLDHSIKDEVKATNQGLSDYILIPRKVSKKFKTTEYPLEFELTAGINSNGHLQLTFVRKNDEDKYGHLE